MARPPAERPAESEAAPASGAEAVGRRIRSERERQGIGLRELSRRVDVSASMVSQVELGRAKPSIGTLYAIVSELGLSLDELFSDAPSAALATAPTSADPSRAEDEGQVAAERDSIVRADRRKSLQLDSGVRWERLTASTDEDVDFLHV